MRLGKIVASWTCNSYWQYSAKTFEVRVPYMKDVVVHNIKICPISKELVITGNLRQKYNIPFEYNGTVGWQGKSRPTGDGAPSE